MAVVLPDKTIDQAEAFRLSKAYRLPPEVALNAEPDVIRFGSFASAFRLDYGLVLRRFREKLNVGMSASIATSASYTDRLSHFSDLDNPVVFEDVRAVLLSGVPAGSGSPASTPCPSAPPDDDSGGVGGDDGPSELAPGPFVPGDNGDG